VFVCSLLLCDVTAVCPQNVAGSNCSGTLDLGLRLLNKIFCAKFSMSTHSPSYLFAGSIRLKVRRPQLVQDAFRELQAVEAKLKGQVKVSESLAAGGVCVECVFAVCIC